MKGKTLLARNSVLCLLCNDHIVSSHQHDFVTCKCGKVSTDGGHSYQRILGNKSDFMITSVSIYDNDESFKDNHKFLRLNFTWGTYGHDGNQPYERIPIAGLTTEHIQAILLTQRSIDKTLKKIMLNELEFRKGNLNDK